MLTDNCANNTAGTYRFRHFSIRNWLTKASLYAFVNNKSINTYSLSIMSHAFACIILYNILFTTILADPINSWQGIYANEYYTLYSNYGSG